MGGLGLRVLSENTPFSRSSFAVCFRSSAIIDLYCPFLSFYFKIYIFYHLFEIFTF